MFLFYFYFLFILFYFILLPNVVKHLELPSCVKCAIQIRLPWFLLRTQLTAIARFLSLPLGGIATISLNFNSLATDFQLYLQVYFNILLSFFISCLCEARVSSISFLNKSLDLCSLLSTVHLRELMKPLIGWVWYTGN